MNDDLLRLFSARTGHFVFESGHHGDLRPDLELLFLQPARVQPQAGRLAERPTRHGIDMVCGPLIEGAFVAQPAATFLNVSFCYTELRAQSNTSGLFPVKYVLPVPFRDHVRGRRVAIVDDVINTGSAVRGTFVELNLYGAQPVAIATLVVLGTVAAANAAANNLTLKTLGALPNQPWRPATAPSVAPECC